MASGKARLSRSLRGSRPRPRTLSLTDWDQSRATCRRERQSLGLAIPVLPARPKQDNSSNLQFAIRKVETKVDGTTISFRYYGHKDYWFRIAKDSYLNANGKKYKLTTADGIKLDENNYTQVKASESTNEFLGNTYYIDFTLTFEPFDTIPATFDFIEGDGDGAFVIRDVSIE